MKHFFISLCCSFLFSFSIFSQEAATTNYNNVKITKELVCHGAAVSIAGTIQPFVKRNFSMIEIKDMIGDIANTPIENAPTKAYDLFKLGKSFNQVVEILTSEFMKLEESVVMKHGLLLPEINEHYEDQDYDDEYNYGDD